MESGPRITFLPGGKTITHTGDAPDISERLPDMLKERDNMAALRLEAQKGIAAYFAGDSLLGLIRPLSIKEDPSGYNQRASSVIFHYDNYPKEVSRKYVQGIYRASAVQRTMPSYNADDPFQARLYGYLNGQYDRFWRREVAPLSLILPELYVKVTKPEPPVPGMEPLTLLQQEEQAQIPRVSVVYPQHVTGFCQRDDRRLEWIAIQCGTRKVDIYTDLWCYCVEGDGKGNHSINSFAHGFSRCPVTRMSYSENQIYNGTIGLPYLADVVNLSIANLQLTSRFLDMVENHLFYKFVMGKATFEETQEGGIGNSTAIVEEGDEKGTTRYVNMPATELDKMIDIRFEKMPQRIYTAGHLQNPSGSITGMSGFAMMLEAVPESDAMAEVSDYEQGADEDIASLIGEGYGPGVRVQVAYPTTFGAKNAASMLSDFTAFVALIQSGNVPWSQTAHEEIVKLLYSKLWFSDADDTIKTKIDEELAAWKAATVAAMTEMEVEPTATPKKAPTAGVTLTPMEQIQLLADDLYEVAFGGSLTPQEIAALQADEMAEDAADGSMPDDMEPVMEEDAGSLMDKGRQMNMETKK